MKETEQTLFLKSNILHIRTNEGEFKVSNPQGALSLLSLGSKKDLYDGKNIEWPGGVEFETIAPHPECNKARECLQLTNGLNCSQAYNARTRSTSLCAKAYKLARLLPKEYGSDYKEFESSEPQEKAPCQHMYQGPDNDGITRCIWCRDPHEIYAPSESQEEQEELWKEARHYIDVWRIEELFKRFTIRRNGDKD